MNLRRILLCVAMCLAPSIAAAQSVPTSSTSQIVVGSLAAVPVTTSSAATQIDVSQFSGQPTAFIVTDANLPSGSATVAPGAHYIFRAQGVYPVGTVVGTIKAVQYGAVSLQLVQTNSGVTGSPCNAGMSPSSTVNSDGSVNCVASSGGGIIVTTVSGLTTYATKGNVVSVKDGTSSSDCTVGGGSTTVVCQYTGSAWTAIGSGNSGLSGMTAGQVPVAATASTVTSSIATSGSGNVCLTTSCVMTTPNLGTPSAINLTNATGAPTWNQNTTGTAAALAATPTLCSTGNAPLGILANGNATGCAALGGLPTLPTTPNSVAESLTSTPSGGVGQAAVWSLPGLLPRNVTGTTSTDTILSTDCNPQPVQYQGSVAVAVTLPTATTLGVANCALHLVNNTSGSATAVTVTPTTWTIVPSAAGTIAQGQSCTYKPDITVSTQWDGECHDLPLTAGTNITITRGQYGPSLSASGGGSSGGTVTYTSAQTASSSDNGKLVVMNCTSACAYTLPNPQPSSTFSISFQSVGTTLASIALGASMTYNGTATGPAFSKYQLVKVFADSVTSTNYEGDAPVYPGAGVGFSPFTTDLQVNANVIGFTGTVATRNTSFGSTAFFSFSSTTIPAMMLVFTANDSTVGVGCTGNSTVAWAISYVDPQGNTITNTQQAALNFTETITANGGPTVSGDSVRFLIPLQANLNNSTGVTIASTYTAGSGCSTDPSYQAAFSLVAP